MKGGRWKMGDDGRQKAGDVERGGGNKREPPISEMSFIPDIFLLRHPTTIHLFFNPTPRHASKFCLLVNDVVTR